MSSNVVIVKIGSSTIVGEDGRLREDVIRSRARDVIGARQAGYHPVVVSSGATASGRGRLGLGAHRSALPDLQAASAVGQGALMAEWDAALGIGGVIAAQVLLTSHDLERRASYLNARSTLGRLLELGAVPIVNENDTTATDELTFGDNDVLAAHVAVLLRARALLLLTDREGLFVQEGGDPTLIPEVPGDTELDALPLADLGSSRTGRGGLASKLAAAEMARSAGVSCVIASALEDGVLDDVLANRQRGTRLTPSPSGESGFKLWLRHAKPARGVVRVDDGAATAMRQAGRSLLPVGVIGSDGVFVAGDAIDVVDSAGRNVGKGIASLSGEEVRAVAGLRSEEVQRLLPEAPGEVIHRDRFVLQRDDVM